MVTNVEIITCWIDTRLTWDPDDYAGIKEIHQPYQNVWYPDVILSNR